MSPFGEKTHAATQRIEMTTRPMRRLHLRAGVSGVTPGGGWFALRTRSPFLSMTVAVVSRIESPGGGDVHCGGGVVSGEDGFVMLRDVAAES